MKIHFAYLRRGLFCSYVKIEPYVIKAYCCVIITSVFYLRYWVLHSPISGTCEGQSRSRLWVEPRCCWSFTEKSPGKRRVWPLFHPSGRQPPSKVIFFWLYLYGFCYYICLPVTDDFTAGISVHFLPLMVVSVLEIIPPLSINENKTVNA